jgi:Tfp pilus assembly protein PilF
VLGIPIAVGLLAGAAVIILLVRSIPERPVAPSHPPITRAPEPAAAAPPPAPPPPDPAQVQAEKDQARARDLLAQATPLLAQSDPGTAGPLLTECVQLDPTNPDCHLALSTMYVLLKNRTQARDHALKFLKLVPDRADEARPIFDDLRAMKVRAAPAHPPPKTQAKKDKPPPSKDVKTASAKEPEAADPSAPSNQELSSALCEEGKELLRQKQYKQASALFNSCLNVDKRNAECNLGLGSSWANMGSQAKASKYYREFLRLAPNHPLAGDVQKLLQQYEGN